MMPTASFCAVSGVFLAGASVLAMEPSDFLLFKKGSFTLRPQLTVAEVFEDNVRGQETGRESDLISTISPGFIAQLGTLEFNHIKLSYTYDRLIYLENSELDANQHHINLGTRIQKRRLTLAGRDDIEFLSAILRGGFTLSGEQVDQTRFFDEYRLTYELTDKTAIYVEGTHDAVDFEDGIRLYDTRTLIGTVGFEFKALSQTSFFGEIYYGHTSTDSNESSLRATPRAEFVGGFLGARGHFTENLTGTVKAGFESREFADGSPGGQVPVVEASVTQRFSDRIRLSATYSRRQRVSVEFFRNGYTTDTVGLTLDQRFGDADRFGLVTRAAYSFADYEDNPLYSEPRSDQAITVGTQLVYDFKIWLRGFFGYDYQRLDSSLGAIIDYDVNRVTLGMTLGY